MISYTNYKKKMMSEQNSKVVTVNRLLNRIDHQLEWQSQFVHDNKLSIDLDVHEQEVAEEIVIILKYEYGYDVDYLADDRTQTHKIVIYSV